MKPLAQRASTMRRSGIRTLMELALQLPDCIHLEIGDPDFTTPTHIIDAAFDAARKGATRYSPTPGLRTTREALARKLRERNGLPATAEQILVTPGAAFGIATALFATVDPGEEVLIPDPGWPNYDGAIKAAGGVPVPYPLARERGFEPDLAALRALVTPRTKALLINSPSNPTGAVFAPETVEALVAFAAEHDLYLISDEVYEEIVFEGEHVPAGRFDRDGRVIGVYAFSKTYAMTGWRLGYTWASPEVATTMIKLAEPFVSCAGTFIQKGGEAALAGPQDAVATMRAAYQARRDAAAAILGPAGLMASMPRGAFYMLVDVSAVGTDSDAVARQLLEEQHVATAPGTTFGAQGAGLLRISLAADQADIEEGCRRIVAFVRQHGGVRQPSAVR
ncbi:MAG: pyridoxal phosphate-dependent aminotransferase [Chloroflexi bacterium]|nr:pyridoxal phosphate-dependent aminotransferase [Chloroflexota bacterium]